MKVQVKTQVKAFAVVVVLLSGIGFSAVGQMNFNANSITFRESANASRTTTHYGNLSLSTGSATNKGQLTADGNIIAYRNILVMGSLLISGSKNFIHPHPTDTSKVIRYVAIESGEALTLARGTAKTVNGQAVIELPEHFSLVTSKTEPITVILTPEAAPVLLYTKQKSREKIVVAMKSSDFSEFRDVEFAYQITGVRDGFEKQEIIVDEDKLDSPSKIRDDVQKRINAHAERAKVRYEDKK
ncbi:MAG: hypothetical protein LBB56_01075 [Chitinispirillales bacterium]|jgi:hypothetical protein|nr:hypothetical protein [Chitinispirillales bacterium]